MSARITNKLPAFVKTVEGRAVKGMNEALTAGTAEAAGMTPQHSSFLVNSMFKNVSKEEGRIVGRVGYTMEYALAVHEATGKLRGKPRPKEKGKPQGNYWDPRGQPEFLKKGFERAEPKIKSLLKGALK